MSFDFTINYNSDGPAATKEIRSWKKATDHEKIQANIKRLQDLVITWDTLIMERGSSGCIKLFTHIPKTAGTSLESMFAQNYPVNKVLHVNAPALEKHPNILFGKQQSPEVIMGHYKLFHLVYQGIDRPVVHMTILRDPVRRIISYYNYIKSSGGHAKSHLASSMPFQDFIESDQFVELHNAQALRLTGQLRQKSVKSNCYDRMATLQLAKDLLENKFSVIGVTERFTEFLIMLRILLGWKNIYSDRKNVSKKIVDYHDLDPSLIDIIREKNDIDVTLHRFAIELFEKRCEQLGIDQATIEDYNQKLQSYKTLLEN